MKAYITKYALTKGIIEAEGALFDNMKGNKSFNGIRFDATYPEIWEPGEFALTLESAKELCNEIKEKEIIRLNKKIKSLERKRF